MSTKTKGNDLSASEDLMEVKQHFMAEKGYNNLYLYLEYFF